jgi:hypothetical protein
MTKPLLSDSQMISIQKVALAGMQVEVTIKRPVFGSDDLGDGAFDPTPAVVTQPASALRGGKLYGYLRQTGGDTVGGFDAGLLATSSTYELGLPISTIVTARDIAVINGRDFFVQDVLDDETWPAMLNCVLRRRE